MFSFKKNWYLPTKQCQKKKKVWCSISITFFPHFYSPSFYLSESHLLSLFHTLILFYEPSEVFSAAIYYLPHIMLFFHPQSEHCAVSCFTLYFTLFLSPSSLPFQLLVQHPHFLQSLHLWFSFPYLRFPLWLADKYHFGAPPQVAAFSFPGGNSFFCPFALSLIILSVSLYKALIPIFTTDTVKEVGQFWEPPLKIEFLEYLLPFREVGLLLRFRKQKK